MRAIQNWNVLQQSLCENPETRFCIHENGVLYPDYWYAVGGRYTRTICDYWYQTYNRQIVLNQLHSDLAELSRCMMGLSSYFKQPYILPNLHQYEIISDQTQWFVNLYFTIHAFLQQLDSSWCTHLLHMYTDDASQAAIEDLKTNLDVLRVKICEFDCLYDTTAFSPENTFSSPLAGIITTEELHAAWKSLHGTIRDEKRTAQEMDTPTATA